MGVALSTLAVAGRDRAAPRKKLVEYGVRIATATYDYLLYYAAPVLVDRRIDPAQAEKLLGFASRLFVVDHCYAAVRGGLLSQGR
jgi:hypothetical protein